MAEKSVSTRGLWRFLNNLKDLFVQDAPSDGKQYARKNKSWAEVQGGGGPVDAYTKEEADALLALKAPKGIPFFDLGYQPTWEYACEAMCNSPVTDAMYFKSHDDDFDYYYVCVYKYEQAGIVRGFYTNTEEFTIGTFEWEMGEGDVKVDYFNPTRVIDNLNSSDEYAALSANQGRVLDGKLGQLEERTAQVESGKQDKLIPGSGITIAADGKTISSSGGGSSEADNLIGILSTSETLFKWESTDGKYHATKTKPIVETLAKVFSVPTSQTYWVQLFRDATNLVKVYADSWDTSAVTRMDGAFQGCSSLETLDIHNLDTSAIVQMGALVRSCSSLKSFYGAGLTFAGVGNFSYTFAECSNLEIIDIRGWECGEQTADSAMWATFRDCGKLWTLIGGSQSLSESVFINMQKSLDLSPTILDRASLRAVINGLADLNGLASQTLTLKTALRAKLTAEDIAIATSKNWVIA